MIQYGIYSRANGGRTMGPSTSGTSDPSSSLGVISGDICLMELHEIQSSEKFSL